MNYGVVKLGPHAIAHGDCLEVMRDIEDQSIDLILADLPYGTTACKWDAVIPFEPLWDAYHRIIKPGGAIVLHAAQPFTTALIASNIKRFCYTWTWDKKFAANFVQAKRMPLRTCEDIAVFSNDGRMPTYYPQMTDREVPIKVGGNKQANKAIPIRETDAAKAYGASGKTYDQKHPTMLLSVSCREERGLHRTQKPVSLARYLVRTYTSPGDLVLDNTMGSGTTGVAAIQEGRLFKGIEKDPAYFEVARKRLAETLSASAPLAA